MNIGLPVSSADIWTITNNMKIAASSSHRIPLPVTVLIVYYLWQKKEKNVSISKRKRDEYSLRMCKKLCGWEKKQTQEF